MTALHADRERLLREMNMLATFTHAEQAGRPGERAVTRVVFTDEDMQARAWLKTLYAEAGVHVREDAAGNTFARWAGAEPQLPAIATGSHTDAIPHAGMFDGTLGVLGGLEAIRMLQHAGVRPHRSIELVMFTAEEPTRFGIGCLGSRLLTGALHSEEADGLRGEDGQTLRDVRQRAGFEGPLAGAVLPQDTYAAFVELHIEQGPLLERSGTDIGVVTHIAAPAGYRISVEGEGGHAGALLMPDRRDALCAAAEIVLAVERAALITGGPDTVATVGTLSVHPGAVNSVPSRVEMALDLRDIDEARRGKVMIQIQSACEDMKALRRVRVVVLPVNEDAPAACDEAVIAAVEQASAGCLLSHRRMISRAYHDALFMARLAPTGMIFIPCRGGVSHRPEEFATVEAMANGVRVLAETLRTLSA